MSYRVCRKFTSSTFRVDNHVCRVSIKPYYEYQPGFWIWNVGFAVGSSRRQVNDWHNNRRNKRAASLHKQLVGRSGMKAIRRGFEEVLKLRWTIEPGDGIVLDCTSGDPERQFHAWSRWHRHHPEWVIDKEKREFLWYRPPYSHDLLRKYFDVKGFTPADPMMNTQDLGYFDCFLIRPKGGRVYLTMEETLEYLDFNQFR